MESTLKTQTGTLMVQRYGDGKFSIGEGDYHHPVLILPGSVQPWHVQQPEEIDEAALASVIALAEQLDILIIGTGDQQHFLPQLTAQLRPYRIVADVMDTGAACRTFNVLISEGRRAAAALLPV